MQFPSAKAAILLAPGLQYVKGLAFACPLTLDDK